LVHCLHPLPGRNLSGSITILIKLPDHGHRPHWPLSRQRFSARRKHGRGRSDVHVFRPEELQEEEVLRGRSLSPPEHRPGPDQRHGHGHEDRSGQCRERPSREFQGILRSDDPIPRHLW
jgi:hypothetical protein